MATPPDYSLIASRGETIARGIQQISNIMANTVSSGIEEYQRNRNVEYAYNNIRRNVFDKQEKYGLTDKEAESIVSRLKYNEGEKIEDYEKRVAPTLANLMIWEKYTEDPNYQVELQNPFVDTGTFISMLDLSTERKGQRELGNAVERELTGDVTALAGEPGPTRPDVKTQEELQSKVAGRLGAGVPVEQKQFEQFPGYRALPSEADIQKQKQAGLQEQYAQAGIGLREAQTGAAKALEEQRRQKTTMDKVKNIADSEDKKAAVQNLKDYNTVVRMKIAASEALKNLKPEVGEEPSEAYLDMVQTLEEIKTREKRIQKEGGVVAPEKTGIQKVAMSEANKIEDSINTLTETADMSEDEKTRFRAKSAQEFANSRGVNIDFDRILMALKQGVGLEEIIENIYKAVEIGKQRQVPEPPSPRRGRVEPTGAPVPNIGGRVG